MYEIWNVYSAFSLLITFFLEEGEGAKFYINPKSSFFSLKDCAT
jgi:hypothetical protein